MYPIGFWLLPGRQQQLREVASRNPIGWPPGRERPFRTIGVKPELLCVENSAIVGECHAATDALALVEDLA